MNAAMRFAILLACVSGAPAPVLAAACAVPSGQHAGIQQAVDDPACTSVVLTAGSYPESTRIRRNVDLVGAGSGATVVEGRIEVVGSVTVALSGFSIANGCAEAGLDISDGSAVSVQDVAIDSALLPCPALSYPVFRDGFEP